MKKRHFFFIFFVYIFSSCIDTIDVALPDNPAGRLVIAGVVEGSRDDYRFHVDVVRTQDLDAEDLATRENAQIKLLYNSQETLLLDNGISLVMPIDSFHALYGGSSDDVMFNILVNTADGKTFTSEGQRIYESPAGSQIKLSFEERSELNEIGNLVERGYVKVKMDASLTNAKSQRVSLRWDVSGVFRFPETPWTEDPFVLLNICFVKDFLPVNKINVINSAEVSSTNVQGFEVLETKADFRFAAGYYYTVIQKAITDEAAGYWQEVAKGISREGTIFDAPAGQIRSNIKQTGGTQEEILGYFYTAGIDTIRHLSNRDETGQQPVLCAFQNVSEACCDCLLLVNSSYDKPKYWIE